MISRKLRNSIIIMIITGFIILNHFYYTMIFWAVNGFFDSFNFNIAAIVFLGSYMIFVSYLHHTYKICSFRQYIISIGSDINFYLVVYPFLRLVINFLIVAFFQFLFLSHVVHAETTTSSIVTSGENTPSETVSTTNPIRFAIGFTLTCVILGGLVFYFNGTFDPDVRSLIFTPDIPEIIQNYAVDLLDTTMTVVTHNPTLASVLLTSNITAITYFHVKCASHMLDFFNASHLSNLPYHAIVEQIRYYALPYNTIARANLDAPIYQMLKCYAQLFAQLKDPSQQLVCRTIAINHLLIGQSSFNVNYATIIKILADKGDLQLIHDLFHANVERQLLPSLSQK